MPGGLGDVVPGCLGNHSQFGSLLLQPSFPSGKGSSGLVSRDRPFSPDEFVLQSPFIIVPIASVPLSIQEEDFLASVRPECCMSSIPTLQDLWTLLLVPVGPGSWPVHGPALLDCRLPSGLHQCCRGICMDSIPRVSTSRVPTR